MHRRFPLQGSDAEKDLEPQQRQFKGLSKSIRRIQRNQRSPQNFLPTISEVEEAQLPWSNYQVSTTLLASEHSKKRDLQGRRAEVHNIYCFLMEIII